MRKPLLVGISGFLWLTGCFGGETEVQPDAGPQENPCALKAEAERTPGFPFDPVEFETNVLPALQATCGTGTACHAPDNATTYTVWPNDPSDPNKCNFAKSFNAVYDASDLNNPRNSPIITAIDGTLATHPIKPGAEDPNVAPLLAYIENAKVTRETAGGGTDISNYFDAAVYAADVQPTFDRANCAVSGCHDLATDQSGFGITANAAAGSAEIAANIKEVAGLVTLGAGADAKTSKIYIFSTNNHAGSVVDNAPALEDWIAKAIIAAGDVGGNDGPVAGCVDTAKFNAAVFRDEIVPVLTGDIDLNNRDGGTSTGCVRGPCHGTDRGPGSFFIDLTRPIDDNLKSFSCFVDLVNPSASQVLACPLDLSRCAKDPHPGSDIFNGVQDLNYQKLLSYLYATNNESTPLDFAFFARNINPLFSDENAVQDGALGLTCADTTACHGVQIATEPPPNGSNFGIIPNSTDPQDLLLNFVSASNFTHFPDATQSSLFLYPTNEIANVDNPLATGLPHPGGEDFAVDDAEALAILKWAGGLRPDNAGFLLDWLIAGVFPASQITDEPIFNEDELEPRIFDPSGAGAEFNQGQWDSFSSDNAFVDIEAAFERVDANDEIAYAVAYVMNTSGRDINALITVDSPNDVKLYVGGQSAQALGGQTSISATLGAFSRTKQITRIMVKVFRDAGDAQFGFSLVFADENGNLLTDVTGELVFKLSPEGGI